MLLATGVVHFSFGPRGSTVLGRQRYSHALFFGFFAERSPAAAHSHFVLPLRAVASHRAPPDGSPTIGRGFLSAPAHSTHAHSADAVPTDARSSSTPTSEARCFIAAPRPPLSG